MQLEAVLQASAVAAAHADALQAVRALLAARGHAESGSAVIARLAASATEPSSWLETLSKLSTGQLADFVSGAEEGMVDGSLPFGSPDKEVGSAEAELPPDVAAATIAKAAVPNKKYTGKLEGKKVELQATQMGLVAIFKKSGKARTFLYQSLLSWEGSETGLQIWTMAKDVVSLECAEGWVVCEAMRLRANELAEAKLAAGKRRNNSESVCGPLAIGLSKSPRAQPVSGPLAIGSPMSEDHQCRSPREITEILTADADTPIDANDPASASTPAEPVRGGSGEGPLVKEEQHRMLAKRMPVQRKRRPKKKPRQKKPAVQNRTQKGHKWVCGVWGVSLALAGSYLVVERARRQRAG